MTRCSIEQIKEDSLKAVREIILDKANVYIDENDIAIFRTTGKKVKTLEQATIVAKDKQEAIQAWALKKFKENWGSWTTYFEENGVAKLRIKFPAKLLKAFDLRQERDTREEAESLDKDKNDIDRLTELLTGNEYFYQGEMYSSLEDMQAAMEEDSDFLPRSGASYNATNYSDYLQAKKLTYRKFKKRFDNLVAQRRYNSTKEHKQELIKVKNIMESMEQEIYNLTHDPDIFQATMAIFNSDINVIESLLEGDKPLIEDIHTAEYMIAYFENISDISSRNTDNGFIITNQFNKIDPEIKEVLSKLRDKVMEFNSRITEAKKEYLLELIDNSPNLKSVFPNQQSEEIRKIILEDQSDIGIVSQFFGTIDKGFTDKQDSMLGQLIRLEADRSRSVAKSYAGTQTQILNKIVPKVRAKLLAMGYGVSNKIANRLFSEVSYDLFYQKTIRGERTGRFIGPFSDHWHKTMTSFFQDINAMMNDIYLNGKWEELNAVLEKKYSWLNDNTNFIDLGRIPEIVNDARFSAFSSFMKPADNAYRQSIIDEIGKHTYDKLVQEQIEKIEDWEDSTRDEIDSVLASFGINDITELNSIGTPQSLAALNSLNITMIRNNPFTFMDSHNKGQQGKVDHNNGSSSNQYQSHMKFNTFYPKQSVQRVNYVNGQTFSVDYHDKEFSNILNDPDLLQFWENINDSLTFMNTTLHDSSHSLMQNSLPYMSKFVTDVLLDKQMGAGVKMSTLWTETKQTIRDLFSTNLNNLGSTNVEDINKSKILNVESKVGMRYKTALLKKEREESRKLSKEEKNLLREEITNDVMLEMTFNLPVIINAYMDMVAEYKAQKEALPKISIYKSLYESIKLKKRGKENWKQEGMSKLENGISSIINRNRGDNTRTMASSRMHYWFTKNILNVEEVDYWIKFGKYYNPDEKAYLSEMKEALKEAKAELASLNSLSSPTVQDLDKMLYKEEEISQLEETVEGLGRDYTLAAAYNTAINKLAVFQGLAWNIPSNILNRINGWYQGMVNDTGKYWKAGNFYITNDFIMKKGLRYLPGNSQYKLEVKKTRLMMEKMNKIQDATNEIDRARNVSGFTGARKKLSPFYLTEYTEWHNQTPQILAILMDETITSKSGKTVPIFDGNKFEAFRIAENGELVLLDDFATADNIASWEDFSSVYSTTTQAKIGDTIGILNGDYSKLGSIYIKKYPFGKTLMTFLSWLPNMLWQRFAYGQKNLALGKEKFNGLYTGAYLSPNTGLSTTGFAVAGIGVMGVMGLGLGAAAISIGAVVLYQIHLARENKKAGGPEIKIAVQLIEPAKALVLKMMGFVVNPAVTSTKQLYGKIAGVEVKTEQYIKAHDLGKLGATEAEVENLVAIINEIAAILTLALVKVIYKSMSGPNDEDEPKTLGNGERNPNYGKNLRSESERHRYNLIENMLTRILGDVTLYVNPRELYRTMTQTSLMSWFDKIEKLGKAINSDSDIISTGPNAGESKVGNQLNKMFLPSIGKGNFGFEAMMEQEFNKNEHMDKWFYSDYKVDRKNQAVARAEERARLTKYWQEQYDYENKSAAAQLYLDDVIKKKVNDFVNETQPYAPRLNYDAEQNRR
jgi:hypothetical protein